MCSLVLTYGQHHAEDEPSTLTIKVQKRPDREVPVPQALLDQRRAINYAAAGKVRPCTSARCARDLAH